MKAKYEKPKILLLDMSEKCESTLRDAGYNVSVGTFGRPYLVPKSDSAFFVSLETCELPNSEEQEVIVANTASPEAANDEPSEEPGEGVSAIWQSGDHGKIDPRPLAMMDVRDAFDRVLAHGGIAVVMLSRRYDVRYIMGSASEYRRFRRESEFKCSNWSFLSQLDEFRCSARHGSEIEFIPEGQNL